MKRFIAIALTATIGLLYVGTAEAVTADAGYSTNDAAAGISGSRHNLGAFGKHVISSKLDGTNTFTGTEYATASNVNAGGSNSATGTTEICVYCHTPHHGGSHAPLWNKGVQTNTVTNNASTPITYTPYGTTMGGTTVTSGDVAAGVSLACLSCHDGTSTFDTFVNAPGKGNGGFNSNNTTATNFNWSYTEDGSAKSSWMTSARLNEGTNLADDHPIAIAYTANVASLRATNTVISAIDLTEGLVVSNANIAQNLWAVDGFFNAGATIADLLKGPNNRVECTSCHDPHLPNKSWNEVEYTWGATNGLTAGDLEAESDGHFLRRNGGNTGSGVCKTCHAK